MEYNDIDIENITIFQAWEEINRINNKIELITTLRETAAGIKTNKLKEILVDGGFKNDDMILNALIKKDGYTEVLQNLYKRKNAYEKYILQEIDRLKISNIKLLVGFLKDNKKMTFQQIGFRLKYSERQVRRFYKEYEGKKI